MLRVDYLPEDGFARQFGDLHRDRPSASFKTQDGLIMEATSPGRADPSAMILPGDAPIPGIPAVLGPLSSSAGGIHALLSAKTHNAPDQTSAATGDACPGRATLRKQAVNQSIVMERVRNLFDEV